MSDLLSRATELERRSAALLDQAREMSGRRWSPVSIQRRSSNPKLAPVRQETARSGRTRFVPIGPYVVSSYVSIAGTCPDSCTFKGGGCYASAGASHLTMRQLDRSAAGMKSREISTLEAGMIDELWPRGIPQDGARGGRDFRLHVGGEVSGPFGARALAAAAERWRDRGGGTAWTYTHRWRAIDRESFGPISALASVERPDDFREAHRCGYAPAIVVPEFPDGHRGWHMGAWKIIPCPYESGPGITCAQCRLCLDRDLFRRREVIAFAAHGSQAAEAKRRLKVVG